MSITRIQGNQVNSSGSVTSKAVTLPSGIKKGNLVVAAVGCGNNATTITGPAGWTLVTINQPAGANATIEDSIWFLVVADAQVGQTSWTWTLSASHTMYIRIQESHSDNGWPVNPVDVFANGDTVGSPVQATTISSGTTATTAQTEELWIAALAYKGSAQSESSITAGWTKDLEATLANNNTATLLYKVASATGAAACSYVIGTAQYWAGCVVAFKDNAASANPVLATSPSSLSFSGTAGGGNPASQNSTLSETAGHATAWTSGIAYGSGSGWLSISPTSGSLAANGTAILAVSPVTGALTAGTYTATVTLTATTGGATATIAVTFTVSSAPAVLALSPTPLAFSTMLGTLDPAAQSATLSETANHATAWTSVVTYGLGSGWLTVSPSSGSLGALGTQIITFTCALGTLVAPITGSLTYGPGMYGYGTYGGVSPSPYTATVTFTATVGGATVVETITFTALPLPATNTYNVLASNALVKVIGQSLSAKRTIGKRGEATMTLYDETGSTHFQQWQRLAVYDNWQNLAFSGYITSPVETKPGFQPLLETQITVTDQLWLAVKRRVAKYYLNQTFGAIILDLVNTVLSQEGVTIGMIVDGGSPIPQVTFSYCTVAQALDAMVTQASSSGTPYFWMIDQWKQLWVVPYTAITGPVTDGTTIDDGRLSGFLPRLTRANPLIRNAQYVTGGNAATSSVVETRKGDGAARSWSMGYPLASAPTITVNAGAKTVGVKGTSGFNYYWAAGDPVITQDAGQTILISTDTLSVTYVGQYPNVFSGSDPLLIAQQQALDGTSGIIEDVLNDDTIATATDGLARVTQQLSRYGVQAMQFQFQTMLAGYAPGQLCATNYTPLGLNNVAMLVEEVDASDQHDGYTLWYQVNAIVGPYDTNWQQYFGNIFTQNQPNSINVGQSGGAQVSTPNFTMGVSVAMVFSASVNTDWYPGNNIFPSNTLYPSTG
jgi:hypothetical protein